MWRSADVSNTNDSCKPSTQIKCYDGFKVMNVSVWFFHSSLTNVTVKTLLKLIYNCKTYNKLEGHSVERMYLWQRSSGGSVNKTILQPRLALAARRQWYFPDVKFRIAVLIRYRRKQSGSGIQTMIQIGLKS